MNRLDSANGWTTVIEAGQAERRYWKDLFDYRELLYFLAWRDILVRYKQTAAGFAWAIIRPVLTMVIFTVVFGRLARLPSGGIPYPIMVFTAMLPWQLFANVLTDSSNSLVNNQSMISKIYFPRLIIPLSTVFVALADFLIALCILFVMMIGYRFVPDWRIFFLPFFVLLAVCAAVGASLWFAALNVKYRDFRYIVPFVVQLGLYISPVGYSSSIVLDKWGPLWFFVYSLNPMVGVIDGFRWAISGSPASLYWPGLTAALVLTVLLVVGGVNYFRRTEKTFTDVI